MKSRITLVLLDNQYPAKDLRRALKRYKPSASIDLIVPGNITNIDHDEILRFGGVDPALFLKIVLANQPQPANNEAVVVLTPSLLHSSGRIFCDHKQASILISTGRLIPKNKLPKAHEYAVLILAALVSLDQNLPTPLTTQEPCVIHPSKYSYYVPSTICMACRDRLPNGGATILRTIQVMLARSEDNGQLVIMLHGIRTLAKWTGKIDNELTSENFITGKFRYGYLHTIGALFHHNNLDVISRLFYEQYKHARELNPGVEISVIAHSFGTLVISNALEKYHDLILDKAIFVNSIIREDYDWNKLIQHGRLIAVLNECAGKDPIPILAKAYVRKAGSSGVIFFSNENQFVINNMNAEATHSSLLTGTQCKEKWTPFLLNPDLAAQNANASCSPAWWIASLNWIPVPVYRLLLISIIVLVLFYSGILPSLIRGLQAALLYFTT